MSILTGFKKVKNYILTSSGYQLLSRWTSSQTVEFDDGKTAQTKLGEINGIAKTYIDMKKATDNSMAASAKAVMEGLENSSALISMTQAEYDALSDEEKTDNNMRAILDANPDVVDAKNVNFDNTNTNLTATTTQSAITELNGKLGEDSHYSFTKYGLTFDFFRKGCVCTFYIHGKTTEKLPLYNMDSRLIIPEKYAPCLTYDFSNEFIFPSRLRITSDGGFIDRNDETPIDTEIRVSGSYVCLI